MIQQDTYDFEERVTAFVRLGDLLRHAGAECPAGHGADAALSSVLAEASAANPFFTQANVCHALREWGDSLREHSLQTWLTPYKNRFPLSSATVLLVLAGNLPLVGFHDYLCGLMSGCRLLVKLSSKDAVLLPFLHRKLRETASSGSGLSLQDPDPVRFMSEIPEEGFDAVIATGSDESHALFARKFNARPHLLRHGRHACAILRGGESLADLQALSDDILLYFGLGCRSVSKLYVPENYDFQPLLHLLSEKGDGFREHSAYMHNYAVQKALMTVSGTDFLDTGFLLLVSHPSLDCPQGVLHYQTYGSEEEVKGELVRQRENLQCVVGEGHLPFGAAQHPALSDYADGADTLAFLCDFYRGICKNERNSYLCAPKNRN